MSFTSIETANRMAAVEKKRKQGGDVMGTLTLRDYFAANAMQSLIYGSFTNVGQEGIDAHRCANQNVVDLISVTAYQYADSMLKAR